MPDEPEEQTPEERVEEQQQRLNAALTSPTDSPPMPPARSPLSDMEAMKELLGTLVTRVDQLAKVSEQQFSHQERVNAETIETMKLAREMIAQMDQQYQELTDLIERLETGLEALVKVNANLTEIVAALLTPSDQKA